MKRLILILMALLIAGPVYATGVVDYPAETAPVSTDLMYLIKGPSGGIGTDRKVTVGNLTKGLTLANFPASANVVSLLSAADYAAFRTLLGVQATITNPVTGTGTQYYLPYWTASGSIGALASLGTSGYVLTSNGAGAAPTWQAPGTGTITGTGTQYYLPIWTSDSAQGTLASLGTAGYVLTSNGAGAAPTWQDVGTGGSMVYPDAGVPVSTGGAWGTSLNITAISDSYSTTSSTTAASSTAVKTAYDLAYSKQSALTYPVTGVAAPTAGSLVKWGASGNTLVDATAGSGYFLSDGTVLMTGAIRPSTAGGQVIGSNALPFSSIYLGNAATNNVQLTAGTTSGAKVVTLPSQTGTVTVAPTTATAGQVFMGTTTAGLGAWSTNVFPSTGTAYRLPVFSATNTMTELAASGTTGQVLTAVTGAIPAWTSGFNGTVGATTPNTGAFTSLTVSKSSGVAGLASVYEAATTSTKYLGWMGPAALSPSESWSYQFASTAPTAGQVMAFAAPTGTGDPNGNKVSAGSWVTPSLKIANGTSALGTAEIASGAKATTVTTAATGVATTDVINWGFNGDPTGVTGYVASANGMLTIIAFPSANNVNFIVANNTAAAITPGAITLNWSVVR